MYSKKVSKLISCVILSIFANMGLAQQNDRLPDIVNGYTSYDNLVTMPDNRVMGSGNAIDIDSGGNIWVFERCGANTCSGSTVDTVLKFSPDGEFLTSFGAGMFVFPHGIVVDDEKAEDHAVTLRGVKVMLVDDHLLAKLTDSVLDFKENAFSLDVY